MQGKKSHYLLVKVINTFKTKQKTMTEHKGIHCCSGKLCRCEQHINQRGVICSLTASSPAFPADRGFQEARKSESWQEPFFSLANTMEADRSPGSHSESHGWGGCRSWWYPLPELPLRPRDRDRSRSNWVTTAEQLPLPSCTAADIR